MTEIDPHNLPPFPKRLPEKIKTIREQLGLTPDEIAPKVGARTGAEILAYENDEDDLLVSVLWAYARLAGNPIITLIDDNLELNSVIKASEHNRPKTNKPIDLALVLVSLAVGIISSLLPRTAVLVAIGSVVVFALLLYPAWNMPWVADYFGRRIMTSIVVAAGCAAFAYAAWPTTTGHLAVECQILPEMSDIEEGKRFGVNIILHSVLSRVFNVRAFSEIRIEYNVAPETDRYVFQTFVKTTARERGIMLTDGSVGTHLGPNEVFYFTRELPPFTKQQVEAIISGKARIYILTWATWRDLENRQPQLYDCLWLQSLPLNPYKKGTPVWHVCNY